MSRQNDQPIRQHSVKVPRLYKVATSILKSFKNSEGSVKTLVYEAKKKHPNVKALFALVSECLKYERVIEEAFVTLDILTLENPLEKIWPLFWPQNYYMVRKLYQVIVNQYKQF